MDIKNVEKLEDLNKHQWESERFWTIEQLMELEVVE